MKAARKAFASSSTRKVIAPGSAATTSAGNRQSRHPDTSERGLGNLGYAYQWWTLPGTQAYSAIGLQGQYIFVDPPSRTVVVKLSYFPPADQAPARETIEFLKAAAAWQPR